MLFRSHPSLEPTARILTMYTNWVQKLATKEYADELVLLACSLELKVRIACVPYTAPEHVGANGQKWTISTYTPPGASADDGIIYVGNNDVHFMWLQPL